MFKRLVRFIHKALRRRRFDDKSESVDWNILWAVHSETLGFFPDSRASLDYFAANFCLFCMLSSWPFPIVLKDSQIFSHQVVSLLHWYRSFLRLQMKSFFLKINVFFMVYVTVVQFTDCIVLPRVWVGKWIVECTHRRMLIDDFRLSKFLFFPSQKPHTK